MAFTEKVVMDSVVEYNEGLKVSLRRYNGKYVVSALNENGFNGTDVDLLSLLNWLRSNRPDLLEGKQ